MAVLVEVIKTTLCQVNVKLQPEDSYLNIITGHSGKQLAWLWPEVTNPPSGILGSLIDILRCVKSMFPLESCIHPQVTTSRNSPAHESPTDFKLLTESVSLLHPVYLPQRSFIPSCYFTAAQLFVPVGMNTAKCH